MQGDSLCYPTWSNSEEGLICECRKTAEVGQIKKCCRLSFEVDGLYAAQGTLRWLMSVIILHVSCTTARQHSSLNPYTAF